MVWAHHMYASGWAPDLNGPFMLTTEMISIPTGVLFLVVIGTIWRGRIWTTLPMMATYAMLWNFIIGGVTGIYLSDVPADYDLHGSMFVTAHFHYTLMGAGPHRRDRRAGLLVPEDDRPDARPAAPGFVSFWIVQIGFNVTFLGMFAVGLAGPAAPRRALRQHRSPSATWSRRSAPTSSGSACWSCSTPSSARWRHGPIAPANPWGAKTLEWTVPNPIPLENFEVLPVVIADPYGYGEGDVPLFVRCRPRTRRPAASAPAATDPVLTGPDAPHMTEGSSRDLRRPSTTRTSTSRTPTSSDDAGAPACCC